MTTRKAKETVAQKIKRLTTNGSFKSRSTFAINIIRNKLLDRMLLDQPSKIIARRQTESVVANVQMLDNNKVAPKSILKSVADKPLAISGRRRSLGYITPEPVASCSNTSKIATRNVSQISTAKAEKSDEFNLIDLSTVSIPISNQEKWTVTNCFGFSPNVSTSTQNMVDSSLIMAESPLEFDIIDNQACLIPESVHKQNDHSKSMNAVRKYLNKMRSEEDVLKRKTPARPLPELIPVRRRSNIILKPCDSDKVTFEMDMDKSPYFGHLNFEKGEFYDDV